MDLGFTGSVVLITGASGGIGSATARAFAAEGAQVAAHYNSQPSRAEALAVEIGGLPVHADLRDETSVAQMFETVREQLGPIEVCVANAGIYEAQDVYLADMDAAQWRATIDSNLTSMFLTCREFLRQVRATGSGSLVMVGSQAGLVGERGHADYAASKAALTGLLRSLKNEIVAYARRGRVNLVSPGWTASPMSEHMLSDEMVARVTATMSFDGIGRSDDVAAAILALASPVVSAHVTGQIVEVAGGMEGRLLRAPRVPPAPT